MNKKIVDGLFNLLEEQTAKDEIEYDKAKENGEFEVMSPKDMPEGVEQAEEEFGTSQRED